MASKGQMIPEKFKELFTVDLQKSTKTNLNVVLRDEWSFLTSRGIFFQKDYVCAFHQLQRGIQGSILKF